MHPLLREIQGETQGDNDPHDALEIAPGVVLAARADRESPTLAPGIPDIMIRPADPQIHLASNGLASTGSAGASAPSLDTMFRAADVDTTHVPSDRLPSDRPSTVGWATRLFIGVLFAMCSAAAAAAWQHYSDTAKAMIADWTPPPLFTTSSPPANAAPSTQPVATDVQAAAATAAPAQASPAVQSPQGNAASAPSPDQAQLLQSMAQQIEQLKASVAQLKDGQEQLTRDMAKASEARASLQSPQPRTAAPLPRSAAAPVRKPKPTVSAAQYAPPPPLPPATAPLQPAPPPQATVETDGNPVVRPPLPLR